MAVSAYHVRNEVEPRLVGEGGCAGLQRQSELGQVRQVEVALVLPLDPGQEQPAVGQQRSANNDGQSNMWI